MGDGIDTRIEIHRRDPDPHPRWKDAIDTHFAEIEASIAAITPGGEVPAVPLPGDTQPAPIIPGAGASGSLETYARTDHRHPFDPATSGMATVAGLNAEITNRINGDASLDAFKVNRLGDDYVTGTLTVGSSKPLDQAGTGERVVLAQADGTQRAEANATWEGGNQLVIAGSLRVKVTAGSGGWTFADRASTPGYQGEFYCDYSPTALGQNGPVLNIRNLQSTDATPNAPQFSLWPGALGTTMGAYRVAVTSGNVWVRNMIYKFSGSLNVGGWNWEAQGVEKMSLTAAGVLKLGAHAGTGTRVLAAAADGTHAPEADVIRSTGELTVDGTPIRGSLASAFSYAWGFQ